MKGKGQKENRPLKITAIILGIIIIILIILIILVFIFKQNHQIGIVEGYGNFRPSEEYVEPLDQVIKEADGINDGTEDGMKKASSHYDDAIQYYLAKQDQDNAVNVIAGKITFLSIDANCDIADEYVSNLLDTSIDSFDADHLGVIYSHIMDSAVDCGDEAMYEKWSNAYAEISE